MIMEVQQTWRQLDVLTALGDVYKVETPVSRVPALSFALALKVHGVLGSGPSVVVHGGEGDDDKTIDQHWDVMGQ